MVISLTSAFRPQHKSCRRKTEERVNGSTVTRISIHVRRASFNSNWSPEKTKH